LVETPTLNNLLELSYKANKSDWLGQTDKL
jgi:hypothetical protein